jgi:archaellum component FlaF (FlaF/FlaG flagellin family)
MKKLFFLFAMFVNVAVSAQRTTPVTIANTKVNYSTKVVTFDLSWKGNDASHRDNVWVFVDIQLVTDVNTLGTWSPATLVPSATTVTAGSGNQYSSLTHTVVSGNTRGVWVKGTAPNTTSAFSATVKVTLNNATPAKFNACAYATDYPPNAASYSNGTYTLKGTQPFTVTGNGTIQDGNKYAGTITSLTDATGCPGGIGRDVIHNNGPCLPHLTPVGGYCRDLVADGASTITSCGVEVKMTNSTLGNGCPIGWSISTIDQLECMRVNTAAFGIIMDYYTSCETFSYGHIYDVSYCTACSARLLFLTYPEYNHEGLPYFCSPNKQSSGILYYYPDCHIAPDANMAIKCVR